MRLRFALVLTSVVLGLLGLGCQPAPTPVRPAPVVGVLVPLSGPAAPTGQALLRGLQLALAELQSGQGDDPQSVTRIVIEDSMGTPEAARAAFERLIDESGAPIVVGAIRPDVLGALAAPATARNVTLLTPLPATANISAAYHLRPGTDYDRRFLNALFASRPDLERLALLTVGDGDSGRMASDLVHEAIERGGRTLVAPVVPDDAGPTVSLVSVAQAHPDAVVIIGPFDRVADYRRPAAELELELIAVTTDDDPALFRLPPTGDEPPTEATPDPTETLAASLGADAASGSDAEPIAAAAVQAHRFRRAPARSTPLLETLAQQYLEAYGESPDAWAAYGYDLLRLADHALRNHDGTANGIRNALDATHRFPGATGLLTFSAERQAHRVLRLVAERGNGPPPFPVQPVWVLGSVAPIVGPPLAEPVEIASIDDPENADTDDAAVDDRADQDLLAGAAATADPDDAPPALADVVIAVVDFAEPDGLRAQTLVDRLRPHVRRVFSTAPSSIASVAALSTAHIYRRDSSDEAGAIAERLAEIVQLETTQHPDTSTGLDAIRRIIATYSEANYFLVVN